MANRFIITALFIAIRIFGLAQDQSTANQVKFPAPGRFHQLLARSNGTWVGEGTMQFSSEGQRVNSGVSMLVNKMSSDGLYQISEVKGNIKPGGPGAPSTGLRITGYDSGKKVFSRAMIGDSPALETVAMEGHRSGKERALKEVYIMVNENTEVLEIYATDPTTNKEFMTLQVTWRRQAK